MSEIQYNFDEKYIFSSTAKKRLAVVGLIGIIITIIGIILIVNSGSGQETGEHALRSTNTEASSLLASSDPGAFVAGMSEEPTEGESHGSPIWLKRLYVSLWQNNIFFTGLALIGVFFLAIQYAAQAGWSAGFKRVPEAMGYWLPIAGIIAVVLFFFAGKDIFHWTHTELYIIGGEHFDPIINAKKGFFFWPADEHPNFPVFWFARMIIFFSVWYWFFLQIRKWSLIEDIEGGSTPYFKMRSLSAIFLVVFAVTSSVAAWDWVMSIDTHWFSSMFGWYVFASWWVAGLALITLMVVDLKEKGLLSVVNANHLHDLGKFVFGFSIFWMYIWFSQFLLIYYANIPEESIYFIERISTHYKTVYYINLILNFLFPFLLFMTRESKRHRIFLKIVAIIALVGHWFDFYLMITPGTMQLDGGFGFIEIGVTMIFIAMFLYVVFTNLAKVPLIAKNHPLLEESLHHDI